MIKLNSSEIKPTIFPDGTSQIWNIDEKTLTLVEWINWDFENEGELIQLIQLVDLIRVVSPFSKISLKLSYLPYGRQDKEISNQTTFALHSFAKVINSLGFYQVDIVDPHSTVATKLIHNSYGIFRGYLVREIFALLDPGLVCYPDAGAYSKYAERYRLPCVYVDKKRDQLTGLIEKIEINGAVLGKKILIIDDIIDGGMTFKLLARELYYQGATEVNLYATHGIFSQGVKTIKDSGIKRIFTAKGEVFEIDNQITYRIL